MLFYTDYDIIVTGKDIENMLIIVLYLVLVPLLVALIIYRLALSDIIFAFCPQGEIKIITKGGSYHDFIHSVSGYYKDGKKLKRLPNSEDEDDFGLLHRLTGMYYVGPWPFYKVHTYVFEWETIVNGVIQYRRELVNSIRFRFEYPLEFEGLETSDNSKVKVVMQVLTETFYPELALFKGRNWLNILKAAIESKLRDFIGSLSFEKIRGDKMEVKSGVNSFVREIMDLSTTSPDDANPCLEDLIGTRIKSANFQRIDGDPRIVDALEAAAIAEREGEADVIREAKKGKAALARARSDARAKVIGAVAETRSTIVRAVGEKKMLESTTMFVASDPAAAKIAEIGALPKTITTLVQRGAVEVTGTKVTNPPLPQPPATETPNLVVIENIGGKGPRREEE